MPFEKINNIRIYYEVHGEGEVIILMHHGFGSTRIWDFVYPRFVAQGYRVVLFDRRGYGRSERGNDFPEFFKSSRYRLESVEELRILKEKLAITECHLVGQCEAGVIGIDYAIKYPQEIKTLTIAGTQCYSKVPMTEFVVTKFKKQFAQLEPNLQAKTIKNHGKAAEINYNLFIEAGGAYGLDYFDLRPVLHLVPCPTLIIYPDRSIYFDVEQSIAFYRHLLKSELAVFPKCGHDTHEERPEDYVRTILDFIMRDTEDEDLGTHPGMTCLA
ncbi:MAG: alpha/beta hydrolase [Proteobacteria bacterium]|nr:alpha/beta hydrolase [Pseudomonadota bacterium]